MPASARWEPALGVSAFVWRHPSTVEPVGRQCSRTGCAEPAVVTLSYDYARALVWIDELIGERDPHSYDLCDRHGSRVTVPQGWQLRDRRVDSAPLLAG